MIPKEARLIMTLTGPDNRQPPRGKLFIIVYKCLILWVHLGNFYWHGSFINVCASKEYNSFVQSADDIRLLRPLMSISYLQVTVSLKWLVLSPTYHVLNWTLIDCCTVLVPFRAHILAWPIIETAETLTSMWWVISCIHCLENWEQWEESNLGSPFNQPLPIDHVKKMKATSSVLICRKPVVLE